MKEPKPGQYFITLRRLPDGQLEATWAPEVTKYLEKWVDTKVKRVLSKQSTPDNSQDELRTRAIADELESLWQIANKYKDGWLKMAELVQANYLPRKDVVEAIGKDEAFVDISEIDHTGKVTNIIKGNSYTPVMVGRNQLRAELRTKLGLDANGESE